MAMGQSQPSRRDGIFNRLYSHGRQREQHLEHERRLRCAGRPPLTEQQLVRQPPTSVTLRHSIDVVLLHADQALVYCHHS